MKSEKAVFVPTREQRNQVCIMVLADFTPEMMAKDLGISKTILKRHFKDELKNGKDQVRKRAVLALATEGLKNKSVPALKAIIAISTETKAPKAIKTDVEPVMAKAVTKFGKKVLQQIEAQDANKGVFATPAPPSVNKTVQ
jgi:hypothetical protein